MASTFISLDGNCKQGGEVVTGVESFNGRTGTVVSQAGDYEASEVTYSNALSGIPATNVQDAIDFLRQNVQTSASPGFSFGRAGDVGTGTYLQCETVPSNVAGRYVYISNAQISQVFVSNELNTSFSLSIYYHDGNSVNETLLGTVSVTGLGGAFPVSYPVPSGKQLSIKVSANSARNIVCGLELRGTT